MEKHKCEWCEEGRYVSVSNSTTSKAIFCMNLSKYNTERLNGFYLELLRQYPPNPIWEVCHRKKIEYCPFCGRKLGEQNGAK